MSAEEGILVEAQGRAIEQWRVKNVGADNHLLDTVVGNFLLAHIRGAELQSDAGIKKLKALSSKKKRRRFKSE